MSAAPHSHVFLGEEHARSERKTWTVIVLCGVMMIAEIGGGLFFGSIALVADGWHMSTHAGALLLSALAYTYSRKHADDPRFSFGTGKLGDLAGFTSAVILALIAVLIGYESVLRVFEPVAIHFAEAIPVACLGLVVNVVSAWLLSGGHDHGHGHSHSHGHLFGHAHQSSGNAGPNQGQRFTLVSEGSAAHGSVMARSRGHVAHAHHDHEHDESQPIASAHRDNNMRAAVVHVAADAAVSVLVIVGLLLARAFGWLWMDPVAGIVGAIVIASWSYGLIRDTGSILLDMNCDREMCENVRRTVEHDGDRVTDLHLWRLGPGHLGAIVCVDTGKPRGADYYRALLARFAALSHLTIEVRTVR